MTAGMESRATGRRALRIVLADDDPVYLLGLATILEDEGHEITARAEEAYGLRTAVAGTLPDLAVIDIRMPPTQTLEGLRAAVEIRGAHPGVGILLLSKDMELTHLRQLLEAGSAAATGGIGYQLKSRVTGADFVTEVVDEVGAGRYAIDGEIQRALYRTPRRRDRLAALTDQQLKVLELMARGLSNSALAAKLSISKRTVEDHVNTVFDKLDLRPEAKEMYDRRVRAVLMYLASDD
ncbi:response regulator transcription factor [Streptomyces lanatus]|uniref:Response regulator transcription factor n=1 Tax=Streptomyces lanatus TaxID=66900 RepID=A0ABV1XLJ4_9ACTN|nr:response regulator transcription factor [Streptomyces lanatus]GHG99145.1 putative two-component system response regulator, LuxR family protein [Streptomyces lanatus]